MVSTNSKSTPTPTIPTLKSKVLQQLQNTSPELVEAWKQTYRTNKAALINTKREYLLDILSFEMEKFQNNKIDFSNKSAEEIKFCAMKEIKEKSKAVVTEEWKNKIIEEKVAILGDRHRVLAEIAGKKCTKNAIKGLKQTAMVESTSDDQRGAVLASIRKRAANDESADIIPAWKETLLTQKRLAYQNKRNLLSEYEAAKNTKFQNVLENSDNFITKRAKLMENIRTHPNGQDNGIVEAWKQENIKKITDPVIFKQNMLMDLITKNHKALVCTKDARELLIDSLKTAEDVEHEPVEAWKVNNNKIRVEAIKNKNAIVCDINEKLGGLRSTGLTKEANRTNLLSEIRQTANQKSKSAPITEAWKQKDRDVKANLIIAKKLLLVDVEQPKAKALKSLKSVEKSESQKHFELMQEIRTEKIPAWKEENMSIRMNAIMNKNFLNNEIKVAATNLKNTKSVQENMKNLMQDIRTKSGNFTEAWKETENNTRAVSIGCKSLINHEIVNNRPSLNQTKSQSQLKQETLKELRLKADNTIPEWKEEILDSAVEIRGNRQKVIYELSFEAPAKALNATKSLSQIKSSILFDIRRPNPIEAWKENQRNKQAELYNNKREVIFEIDEMKHSQFQLDCFKSQTELRKDLLREIRSKNVDFVVPEWKENKMEKRAEVYGNKRDLNRCIERLNV
jgi:hypothetical protein